MSRAKSDPPSCEADARVTAKREPPMFSPLAAAQRGPRTTREIFEILRQNHAEGGSALARRQLAEAICGCVLYSIEIDGVEATIKLLAEMALAVQQRSEVLETLTATKH